jgi:hypothetical protein
LKTLRFAEELTLSVIRGEKRITIRKLRMEAHMFEKGECAVAQFGDEQNAGALIRMTARTLIFNVEMLPDEFAREDGHRDRKHAFEYLKRFYPDLDRSDQVAVIRFEPEKAENGNLILVDIGLPPEEAA